MMKVLIGHMEIDIKCKDIADCKFSKKKVLRFLNELSVVYNAASEIYGMRGANEASKDFSKKSDALYRIYARKKWNF